MARHNLQPRPYMRFLCAPESVLTDAIQPVKLAPNHDALIVGCELAFVIRKLARSVPEAEAENYILGYAPLVSLYDTRFERQIIDPASPQEKHIPLVYGRWPDASNIIGAVNATPYPADSTYTLSFSTGESVSGAISEYVHQAAATLAKISHHITLLPGDVVSLGTLSHTLPLPTETPWEALSIHAEISGFAPLTVDLTS